MSNIHDVAKKAGVSVSSVSLAYHKPYQLSDKTRVKILKVAEELGYYPNPNKIPKMTATIAIAIPVSSIKQTQIPLATQITEILMAKQHRTTIINYSSLIDLEQKIKSLESDKNIKGIIIVYNEKEDFELKKHSIPTIIVSPHTFNSKCINIGYDYLNKIMDAINDFYKKGFIRGGVLVEKDYIEVDYLQKAKEQIIKQYEELTQQYYPTELLCFLQGDSTDFDRVQKYTQQQNPEFWIFVGPHALNVAQSVLDQSLEGILIIEQDAVYGIKSKNKILILQRPISKIALLTVETLFTLINNNQSHTKERISV